MIHFELQEEPAEFDSACRQKGRAWVESQASCAGVKRPPAYWGNFRPDLMEAFRCLCAYSAMYEPVGTVDHFRSWKAIRGSEPLLAFEWSNFRFASHWINAVKQDRDDLLDPFEVDDDWFEISLPSLQLVVTDRIPGPLRAKAERTLERLCLRDDERVIRQRREWFRLHEEGELSLEGLRQKAPLIARAVELRDSRARDEASSGLR